MATVKFRYSSWQNISFKGLIDSGVDREDWNEMTDQEQRDVEYEVMNRLVDLEVED